MVPVMLTGLKRYRTEQGLSQRALGKALGVHAHTVFRWEKGERKIDDDLLEKVADVTGLDPAELRPDLAIKMRVR